jgi:hypothetical protein
VDIDAFINAAVAKLADLTVDPVVQWTIACELIALKYEWTVDEASTNLAALLESLADRGNEPA